MLSDTNTAFPSSDAETTATTHIFAQRDCLQRWADNDDFWQAQPYGNRFYFSAGAQDYISRDVVRALLAGMAITSKTAQQPCCNTMIPACGDLDCPTCDLVPISAKP
ncbi:hypothetical protein LJR296_007261 [Cupriavidus necator]|uniref:hypothetical protein n=1 Tax=Cupriavidus necator TaxID=106590 RepID=UPI003ECD1AE4